MKLLAVVTPPYIYQNLTIPIGTEIDHVHKVNSGDYGEHQH